jgi:hypothetical protein
MLAGGEQVQLFDQVETLEFEVEVVVLLAFELEVISFAFAVRGVLNGGFEWSGVGFERAFAIEQVENPSDGVELFLPVIVDSELGSAPGAFAIPAEDDSAAYSERVVGFEVAMLWAECGEEARVPGNVSFSFYSRRRGVRGKLKETKKSEIAVG